MMPGKTHMINSYASEIMRNTKLWDILLSPEPGQVKFARTCAFVNIIVLFIKFVICKIM